MLKFSTPVPPCTTQGRIQKTSLCDSPTRKGVRRGIRPPRVCSTRGKVMWGAVEARWTPSMGSEIIHMRGGKWWLLPVVGVLVGVMMGGDWVWPSRAVVGVFHSRYIWGWRPESQKAVQNTRILKKMSPSKTKQPSHFSCLLPYHQPPQQC